MEEKEVLVKVNHDGSLMFIYDENLTELEKLGDSKTKRASHVEPSEDVPGEWDVDLSPSGGPKVTGFKTRSAGIQFEIDWINKNLLSSAV
jgi:hypothetical protein